MQNFRALGALPQTPVPPAAGGFAPRPPLAYGGWGLRPQTPKLVPPLRISGYASDLNGVLKLNKLHVHSVILSIAILTSGM